MANNEKEIVERYKTVMHKQQIVMSQYYLLKNTNNKEMLKNTIRFMEKELIKLEGNNENNRV